MIDINPILPGARDTWPPTTDYKEITNSPPISTVMSISGIIQNVSLAFYPRSKLSRNRQLATEICGVHLINNLQCLQSIPRQFTVVCCFKFSLGENLCCVFLAKGRDTTGDMNELKFKFKTTMDNVSSPFLEKIFAYFCIFVQKWSFLTTPADSRF